MSQPSPLSDMIRDSSDSYETMAARRARPEGQESVPQVSVGYLHRIASGKVDRVPTARHLRAIAAALDVPYETVQAAAIIQWMAPTPEALRALRYLTEQQLAKAARAGTAAEEIAARADPPEGRSKSA